MRLAKYVFHIRAILIVTGCLFSVVACGRSNPAASIEDKKVNSNIAVEESGTLVCSVVSKAEIESLFSEPVMENVRRDPSGAKYCEFRTSTKSFEVLCNTHSGAIKDFDNFRNAAKSKEGFAGRPVKSIQGVGDEAYWLSGQFDEFSGGTLTILKKNTYVIMVSYRGPNQASAVEIAKQIAIKAVERFQATK